MLLGLLVSCAAPDRQRQLGGGGFIFFCMENTAGAVHLGYWWLWWLIAINLCWKPRRFNGSGGNGARRIGHARRRCNAARGLPIALAQTFIVCCIHIMKLTAVLKRLPTPTQADALHRTLTRANAACDAISRTAWETRTWRQFAIHRLCYTDTRETFGLAAQLVVRCIAKVADAYNLDRKVQRTFAPLGAVAYDARILRYTPGESSVSIWTLDGRQAMGFVCGPRQRQLLATQRHRQTKPFNPSRICLHVLWLRWPCGRDRCREHSGARQGRSQSAIRLGCGGAVAPGTSCGASAPAVVDSMHRWQRVQPRRVVLVRGTRTDYAPRSRVQKETSTPRMRARSGERAL